MRRVEGQPCPCSVVVAITAPLPRSIPSEPGHFQVSPPQVRHSQHCVFSNFPNTHHHTTQPTTTHTSTNTTALVTASPRPHVPAPTTCPHRRTGQSSDGAGPEATRKSHPETGGPDRRTRSTSGPTSFPVLQFHFKTATPETRHKPPHPPPQNQSPLGPAGLLPAQRKIDGPQQCPPQAPNKPRPEAEHPSVSRNGKMQNQTKKQFLGQLAREVVHMHEYLAHATDLSGLTNHGPHPSNLQSSL